MRKKVILLAAALILAVSLCACSDEQGQDPALGRYASGGGMFSPALILEDDQRYILMGPAYISLVLHGIYTIEGERLILGSHVFIIEGDTLVFEGGRWLENFVEPGTRFYLSGE